MERQVVNMSKWSVSYKENGGYNLSGLGDNHPKLGRNIYIQYTSKLEKAELVDDVLIYITKNTEYHCPLKYAGLKYYIDNKFQEEWFEEEIEIIKKEDTDINKVLNCFVELSLNRDRSDFTNHILSLNEQGMKELENKKRIETNRLLDIVKDYENSVYLEISKISDGDDLVYNVGGKCGLIEPYIHVGMIQDSILYMDNVIDFRYFPKGMSMETYSCSDNIEKIVVKNMKGTDIRFNNIVVKPNEIKEIKSAERG